MFFCFDFASLGVPRWKNPFSMVCKNKISSASSKRDARGPAGPLGEIGLESRRSGSAGHVLRRIRHEHLKCEEARLCLGCSLHAFGARVKLGYVMPAGASKALTRTACARVSRARAICALVSLPVRAPVRARACAMSRRRRKRACAEVRGSAPVALAEDLPSWMLGVSDGWPSDHPAERVGVKLLHEVSAVRVAAGDVHHSLEVTIDGPNVETLLGLTVVACHISLIIQQAGDGRSRPTLSCTAKIHPPQHRAFGETCAIKALGLLYDDCMLNAASGRPRRFAVSVASNDHRRRCDALEQRGFGDLCAAREGHHLQQEIVENRTSHASYEGRFARRRKWRGASTRDLLPKDRRCLGILPF